MSKKIPFTEEQLRVLELNPYTCFKYDSISVNTKTSQKYITLKNKGDRAHQHSPSLVLFYFLFNFSRKTFVQPCHTFQSLYRLFIKLSFLHSPGPVSAKCRRYIDSCLAIQVQ